MKNEIILPVAELKEALPGLSKVIGRKSTLPVLEHVRVLRDHKGNIHIQATDLDTFVTYTATETQAGPVIDVLVPFEQLSKTVKGSGNQDTLTLVPEAKDRLTLRYFIGGSPVEQKLNTLTVEEFPPTPAVTGKPVSVDRGFDRTLKEALQCASDDPSRYVLNGVYLDVADKKYHYVVGTNGRILYSANSLSFDLKQSLIIPSRKFLGWSGFSSEECLLAVEPGKKDTGGWVQLQTPRWTFITKQTEGPYPNWKQVIPPTTEHWTRVHLSDGAVKQLLQVIPKIPGYEPNHPVRLSVSSTGLNVEGRNRDDKEWTKVPIADVGAQGKAVAITFNREYVLKALRFGLNEIEIEHELSPAVFTNKGRKLIVMPLRLDDGPAPNPATPATPEAKTSATSSPPKPETKERNNMPRVAKPVVPAAESGHNGNGNGNGHPSALKPVVDQIETIKDNLKGVVRDLNQVQDLLKLAEKEKRTTEREINGIRNQLRKIQTVTI